MIYIEEEFIQHFYDEYRRNEGIIEDMEETLKEGKVTSIDAITMNCLECGDACESEDSGSDAITQDDKVVRCHSCGTRYSVPKNAFMVPRDTTRRNPDN